MLNQIYFLPALLVYSFYLFNIGASYHVYISASLLGFSGSLYKSIRQESCVILDYKGEIVMLHLIKSSALLSSTEFIANS